MPETRSGPLEELHGEERPATCLVDIIYGADVRVIQRRCGAGLSLKAREGGPVPGDAVGEEFQCDATPQSHVLRAVDLTHATAAEPFQNPVV